MKTYKGYKLKVTGTKGKYVAYVFLTAPYLEGERVLGLFATKSTATQMAESKINDWRA